MSSFARVRDWVFDLDNTLYPAAVTLYDDVGVRMTEYIARALGVGDDEALVLRERYFHQYGATVAGLALHHGVDAADFLEYVHDIAPDMLTPDRELNALIAALPGRRIVFTNGGGGHARRVLAQLELSTHFERVCDIETGGLTPKPQRGAYERLVAQCGLDPTRTVLIEDTLRNLEPAHEMGFVTVLVGPVHPAPLPAYVHHYAHDLTAFLRSVVSAPRAAAP
ncbi:MAG: pyrimidine 5'-nucleotidase [Hyphomonadaceae bacterium]